MNAFDYQAAYDHPDEVLKDERWSTEQKRKILCDWHLDAQRREGSTGEGFERQKATPSFLGAVERAQRELDQTTH